MSTNHTKSLQTSPVPTSRPEVRSRSAILFLTLLAVGLASTDTTVAQRSNTPAVPMTGGAIRERNRQMDEYDRELDRLRNGPKAPSERRKNLFPQINEDFQKIQVLHNEIIRLVQSDNSLKYDRLIELTAELKKRGNRLRTNLALPDESESDPRPEKTTTNQSAPSDAAVKESIITLHDVIVSFVSNPLFKNLGLLDAREVSRASDDLRDMIQISDNIKKSAETLGKTAKK